MRNFRISLLILLIATQAASLTAQRFVGPSSWFTLGISEEHQLRTPYTPEAYGLLVKYTNVSKYAQVDPCVVDPWVYSVQIVYDDLPLEKKKDQEEEKSSGSESRSRSAKIHSIMVQPCTGLSRGNQARRKRNIPKVFDYGVRHDGARQIRNYVEA